MKLVPAEHPQVRNIMKLIKKKIKKKIDKFS